MLSASTRSLPAWPSLAMPAAGDSGDDDDPKHITSEVQRSCTDKGQPKLPHE